MNIQIINIIRGFFGFGNFVGRFASGLVVIMPVLLAKYRTESQSVAKTSETPSKPSCFDHVKKCITVRFVYCMASAVLCTTFLLIALIGLGASGPSQTGSVSDRPATSTITPIRYGYWATNTTNETTNGNFGAIGSSTIAPISFTWNSMILLLIYFVVGVSAGCLFSQFPVVLAELVGLQRLAAGHALFMLVQVPCSGLHFLSGIFKKQTGSWAHAYMILFTITLIITILNSLSLLCGNRIRRFLCRK